MSYTLIGLETSSANIIPLAYIYLLSFKGQYKSICSLISPLLLYKHTNNSKPRTLSLAKV